MLDLRHSSVVDALANSHTLSGKDVHVFVDVSKLLQVVDIIFVAQNVQSHVLP